MATLSTRGDSYVLSWTDPATGARQRRTIGSRTTHSESEAQAALKALEYELATGNTILKATPRTQRTVTFVELADRYLAWREEQYPDSQPGIELIVNKHLLPFFERQGIDSLSADDGEAYVAFRAKSVVPSTLNKELRTLKAVLNKAVEWKLITENPVQYVKGRQEIESAPVLFYTADEMQRIYSKAADYEHVWRLMVNTGLRRSEALALRWEDCQLHAITVVSTTKSRTKSRKWRHVPLSPGARTALWELKNTCVSSPYVVPHITKMGLTKAFERALDAAGLDGSLHRLRHTFASHLVMAGRPLYEVQLLLGHANIKTTQQYAHLAPGYLQDAVKGVSL